MSALEALVKAAREQGEYGQLLAALPYGRFLGLDATLQGERVRVHLLFKMELVGNTQAPAIHGGVVGAALETAAMLQLIHVRGLPFPKTIDLSVDYLLVARAEPLYAVAEIQRLGRRIANVHMRAYQSDETKPVAMGRGNFVLD